MRSSHRAPGITVAAAAASLLALTPARAQVEPTPERLDTAFGRESGDLRREIEDLKRQWNEADPGGRRQLAARRDNLRGRVVKFSATARGAINAGFRRAREAIVKFNADNRRLAFESVWIGSRVDL